MALLTRDDPGHSGCPSGSPRHSAMSRALTAQGPRGAAQHSSPAPAIADTTLMWIRRALVPTALLACTLSGSPAPAQPAPAPTATARTAAPQAAAAARPAVTKLLVFVEENHSLRQMRTGMPYTFGL